MRLSSRARLMKIDPSVLILRQVTDKSELLQIMMAVWGRTA